MCVLLKNSLNNCREAKVEKEAVAVEEEKNQLEKRYITERIYDKIHDYVH